MNLFIFNKKKKKKRSAVVNVIILQTVSGPELRNGSLCTLIMDTSSLCQLLMTVVSCYCTDYSYTIK